MKIISSTHLKELDKYTIANDRDRDGGQQRALRCILRQEVRAQDDGEPDALAGRRPLKFENRIS